MSMIIANTGWREKLENAAVKYKVCLLGDTSKSSVRTKPIAVVGSSF